jgi:hypothetical protein
MPRCNKAEAHTALTELLLCYIAGEPQDVSARHWYAPKKIIRWITYIRGENEWHFKNI